MTKSPDSWTYGDFAPDPASRDLPGLKARWLVEQLPADAAPRVLDFGAGEGKYLHLVRRFKPGAQLTGVDIRAPHTTPDFEFRQVAPGDALPFPSGSFDVVISCDVLEHVADLDQSLLEIRRVLREGGVFIGFVPAEGGFGPYALLRLFDRDLFRDTKDHVHAYTRRELRRRFSAGFRIARLAYSYHLIGATMDAAFFGAFKLPMLGPRLEAFWRGDENDVYRSSATRGQRRSLASRLIGIANQLAYFESVLCRRLPLAAKGVHFHLEKR